jgi:cysteine desulfurase / selenocysteine lyase
MELNKTRQDFTMLTMSNPIIYFDNAATTLKPKSVSLAVNQYNELETSSIHRGDYDLSVLVSDHYEKARNTIARFINASANEIVFTSGTTDSINRICFGFGRNYFKQGDVILTTMADHASNLLPWFQLAKEKNLIIEYIDLTPTGQLTIENFKHAMHNRVKLVAIAHITNVMGHIAPIKEIATITHQHNAILAVDAAQSVPHIPTDVSDLDVDFLSFSGHKMCGPTGVGVLYGKYHLLEVMDPIIFGGGSNARFDHLGNLLLKKPPFKFEAGTPPIGSVLGLQKAVEYLEAIGMDAIIQHETNLRQYLVSQLSAIEYIHVYNPDATSGIVAFNVNGIFAQDVSVFLNSKNIAVRAGDHCAKLLVNLINTPTTVRASLYFYNTKDEVDALVNACQEITLEKCIELAM